jgi:hypothetical protein
MSLLISVDVNPFGLYWSHMRPDYYNGVTLMYGILQRQNFSYSHDSPKGLKWTHGILNPRSFESYPTLAVCLVRSQSCWVSSSPKRHRLSGCTRHLIIEHLTRPGFFGKRQYLCTSQKSLDDLLIPLETINHVIDSGHAQCTPGTIVTGVCLYIIVRQRVGSWKNKPYIA